MSATATATATATTTNPPSEQEQEAVTKEVRAVGLELSTIKNAIKKLTIDRSADDKKNDAGTTENSLKVTALKVRSVWVYVFMCISVVRCICHGWMRV
jgi:hypothetical protein